MRPILTTPRLTLRPMREEHLPLLVALDADPEVLRYLLGRARTTEEAREFWGPRAADLDADRLGLGFWVGFEQGPGPAEAFVGWWDLEPSGDRRAEAGWRLGRRWWRRGLASEGARALLAHGFGSAGLDVVFAETMATNLGSRGVMERLGMRHVRTEHRDFPESIPGAEQGEVVYEISREEWTAVTDERLARQIVIMGVSGSGKSTVGEALARRLEVPYVDGDALHPVANVEKMTRGHPLDDHDRASWLARCGTWLEDRPDGGVIACSALKRSYRDVIRSHAPSSYFVLLTAGREVLACRLAQRSGHFMPASLLDSQLATLEPLDSDERGTTLDVDQPEGAVVAECVRVLGW